MTADDRTPARTTSVHGQAPALIRTAMRSLSRLSPGLAARLAADLFMRPLRPKPRPRELKWIEDARPETLPTRFGDLAGWSWGEGPTVLLLHGWNGRGSQMGLLARAIAGAGFRALAFDGPAHGRSPGRRTNLINNSEALLDVARQVSNLQGIVSHSFGALAVSYQWAELPPLRRLVMISPPAEMTLYSRMFIDAVGASDEVHDRILQLYHRRFGIVWDEVTVENMAPDLDVPLLVIHDRTDRQAPFSHGRRTCQAWAGARLYETRDLGHLRILRDPGVAEAMVGFLADED